MVRFGMVWSGMARYGKARLISKYSRRGIARLGNVRWGNVPQGTARLINKYFMVRRDGVRLCWARSGVAMLGKVRIKNK